MGERVLTTSAPTVPHLRLFSDFLFLFLSGPWRLFLGVQLSVYSGVNGFQVWILPSAVRQAVNSHPAST